MDRATFALRGSGLFNETAIHPTRTSRDPRKNCDPVAFHAIDFGHVSRTPLRVNGTILPVRGAKRPLLRKNGSRPRLLAAQRFDKRQVWIGINHEPQDLRVALWGIFGPADRSK
jgi:hypothetical protein